MGREAFLGCRHLRRVRFPSSLLAIGQEAFCGCLSLSETNLPEGLRWIEWGAFWGHSFQQITIPLVRRGDGRISVRRRKRSQ